MSLIAANLQAVNAGIEQTLAACGRPAGSVRLLAVSKTFSAVCVCEAARCGQMAFGENYLQESLEKITQSAVLLPDLPFEWHFIGPIQGNKTGQIAEHFAWVHSIDRVKIAHRLNDSRPVALPPLNVCIQVNISNEASKGGVMPGAVRELAAEIMRLPRLKLRGLMAIPEPTDNVAQQRAAFASVRQIFEVLNTQGFALDTLSMGMSQDMDAAIAEGATIVRIGTAIFGQRGAGKT